MAQISETLYTQIADPYAAISVSLSTVESNARVAVDFIVDVDTLDYPTASAADPDAALEIELALLQTFNAAYIGSAAIASSTASLLDAISAVNDFVIKETAGTDTSAVKLLAWINTDMSSFWTDSYCPDGWADFCRDAGYNVVGWNTVSVPSGLTE